MAGVFSLGTAFLVIPLVISTVGPIVSFHAKHEGQSKGTILFIDEFVLLTLSIQFLQGMTHKTNLPRRGLHVLRTINECMTKKVDDCTTLSEHWTDISNKVYELSELLSQTNNTTAVRLARQALSEWDEVSQTLERYEMLVEELVSSFYPTHKGYEFSEPISTCRNILSTWELTLGILNTLRNNGIQVRMVYLRVLQDFMRIGG